MCSLLILEKGKVSGSHTTRHSTRPMGPIKHKPVDDVGPGFLRFWKKDRLEKLREMKNGSQPFRSAFTNELVTWLSTFFK